MDPERIAAQIPMASGGEPAPSTTTTRGSTSSSAPSSDSPARTPRIPAASSQRFSEPTSAARGLEISTLELDTGRVCYTIDTLRCLRAATPPSEPVFILGMDALLELPTWREYEQLVCEFDLIVVDREGQTLETARPLLHPIVAERLEPFADVESVALALGRAAGSGRIYPAQHEPIPISSSEIRQRAAAGASLDGLVPPAVARYIQRHGFYRQEDGH